MFIKIIKKFFRFIRSKNKKSYTFTFVLVRPEFRDFIKNIIHHLENNGHEVNIMEIQKLTKVKDENLNCDVVVYTNEDESISRFPTASKVLLPHSILMRDDIISPLEQGAFFYSNFNYFFAPSIAYEEWIIKSLYSIFYLPKNHKLKSLSKKF